MAREALNSFDSSETQACPPCDGYRPPWPLASVVLRRRATRSHKDRYPLGFICPCLRASHECLNSPTVTRPRDGVGFAVGIVVGWGVTRKSFPQSVSAGGILRLAAGLLLVR